LRNLMLLIQHRLNPLHVYCRLVGKGLEEKCAMSMCKWYEMLIYRWLARFSAVTVDICNACERTT